MTHLVSVLTVIFLSTAVLARDVGAVVPELTSSGSAAAWSDGVSGELAILSARLQRLAVRIDANLPAFQHPRRSRVHGRPVASQQAGVEVQNTPLVASTELNFKGHKLNIVTLMNDEFIGATIRNDKAPFQQDPLGTLVDLIPPGSTVVDAGANNGMFSAFLAAAFGPSGYVYSFEPQARMFQVLCTNSIVNSLLHIVPKNLALSYKPDTLHMTSKVVDGTSSNQAYTEADRAHKPINYGGMRLGQGGEEVRAITLDSLNLQNVSLIKVDVQGAEQLMFYGARDTIRRNMPVIAYESNEAAMAAALSKDLSLPEEVRSFNVDKFLEGLGYMMPPAFRKRFQQDKVMRSPGHPMLQHKGLADE